jgi:hypothetical protein
MYFMHNISTHKTVPKLLSHVSPKQQNWAKVDTVLQWSYKIYNKLPQHIKLLNKKSFKNEVIAMDKKSRIIYKINKIPDGIFVRAILCTYTVYFNHTRDVSG